MIPIVISGNARARLDVLSDWSGSISSGTLTSRAGTGSPIFCPVWGESILRNLYWGKCMVLNQSFTGCILGT